MLPLELPEMTRKNATVWVRESMSARRRFRLCVCVCVKEIKGDDEMRMELSPPRPAVCSFYTSFRRDTLAAEQSRTLCGSIRPPNPTPPPLASPPSRNGHLSERDGELGFRIIRVLE